MAAAIADALGAPLDLVLVRKIGAPGHPEYAIGAVAEGGVRVLAARALERLRIDDVQAGELVSIAESELVPLGKRYADARPMLDPTGRAAVVVDDGLATGQSAVAAVRAMRRRGAATVVLAAPVAARHAADALRREADEVLCVAEPDELLAVGYWYEDFSPTSDEDVFGLLRERRGINREPGPP